MGRENNKRVTIHDVARAAETSATTVSRVLSETGYPVREELRSRILKAVRELNYKPNVIAQSLKSNKSRDIGVIMPTITNPFYSNAVLGMEEEANRNNYNLLLCNTLRDPEREARYLQMLYEKQVKGIILSSVGENHKIIEEINNSGVSFVLLDQRIPNDNCSFVGFDVHAGAKMGVKHLIDCGHRRIAFVTTPITRWSRRMALQGYKDALQSAQIAFSENYVLVSRNEEEGEEEGYEVRAGRSLATDFIKRRLDATAVLTVNDMVAFGFIQELNRHGKKVPEDISVMGFDDIPFASLFSPALTTICHPSYETGKLAAKVLFEKLNDARGFVLNVKLEPRLVVRDSVRRLE